MSELTKQSCEACSADAPTVTADQKQALGKDVPDWQEIELDGEEQLQRVFKLKNFAQAQAFTNKVGDLVRWWTHKIGGLHKNDYIMAARTDAAYKDMQ